MSLEIMEMKDLKASVMMEIQVSLTLMCSRIHQHKPDLVDALAGLGLGANEFWSSLFHIQL